MLTDLRLKNFKAFRELELDLAPLTLLSGWNSAGKSSVLQALACLRQSFDAGVLESGLLLNGALVEMGTGRDVLHEDYSGEGGEPLISIGYTEGEEVVDLVFAYEADSDLLPWTASGARVGAGSSLPGEKGFHLLKADRHGPAPYYVRSYHAVEVQHTVGTRGEHAANYLRLHQDDHVDPRRRSPDGQAGPTLLDQVSAWLQYMSPGVNVDAQGNDAADIVTLTYGYGGRAGLSSSNRYRATNVGFGLSYVLPIVVVCLTAEEGSLLLIENPEAHLHPRGQAAVANLLAQAAASGVQVLVESHSDHLLNGFRRCVKHGAIGAADVAVHFFAREVDSSVSVTSPQVGVQGSLSEWPEGFFDEWDRAITDLLS